MDFFVARQPILDFKMEIFGYELLFRGGPEDHSFDGDPEQATSWVIEHTSSLLDQTHITGGNAAFVNVTQGALVQGLAEMLPAATTVVEILETVEPVPEVLRAIRDLKKLGFQVALDDFVYTPEWDPILQLVDIVKVDFRTTNRAERQGIREHLPFGVKLLAEKVESHQELQEAREDGYVLFQGYFLERPSIVQKKIVPSEGAMYAELLMELQKVDLDFDRLEGIIKRNPTLTYKFFRYINRPTFGWRREIEDLKQAFFLVGERELRKWLTLLVMSSLGQEKPAALIQVTSIRARMCELVAGLLPRDIRKIDAFLAGMFSTIDAFMDLEMKDAIQPLPLTENVRDAILGKENDLFRVLEIVRAYERGHWAELKGLVEEEGVPEEKIPECYVDAVNWASLGDPSDMAR